MVDEAKPGSDSASHDYRAEMSARDMAERAVLSIARLLGRRVAREHFEELQGANDNKVHPLEKTPSEGEGGDGGGH
ncbi:MULTISPECIES: hypothetical protein [unclassified Mesorhizobium]|uniref:hypothetical protein n=2 Tax=unclassified Mesorhizobium TaxID=325217 RepID=UPI0003CE7542|nr:hypothetical protein [Mesorhizobium sp. LSJC280B00]ESW65616.1 hypothetical protein X772_35355 [Mesorhizobium sp. LSJC280B00]ESX64006.1 hypothetical protein X759_32745 [Mesorhizobium sp. LSHC420B00]